MSDLIDRQAAIDIVEFECGEWSGLANTIVKAIEQLPPAQPEIVRCKDCKHMYVEGDNVRYNTCELNHNNVQSDDWFCADAERKEVTT